MLKKATTALDRLHLPASHLKSSFLFLFALCALTALLPLSTHAQGFSTRSAGEIIFSNANVTLNQAEVNTNTRFTLFFHTQQQFHLDATNNIGLFTGISVRNIGLITEDRYQNLGFTGVDNTHEHWNKTAIIKRRSYSLGVPLALKLGSFSKNFFLYGGGEIEWMFHYKQKLFLDDNKTKFKEWGSDRVNPFIPSVFAGIQFPKGVNLKFKYYLENFLNQDFRGTDFGQSVDYSQFDNSGIWYVSLSFFLDKEEILDMVNTNHETTAYRD
ncbi:MAG: hypothetical protein R2751_10895 [Bacteroidales bacterium]